MCFIECSRPTANLLVWNIELICVRRKWSVTEGARVAHAQVFRGAVKGFLTRCSVRFQVCCSWSPSPCLFLVNYGVSQKVEKFCWETFLCLAQVTEVTLTSRYCLCVQLFGMHTCNVRCKVSGSDFSAIKIWLSATYRRLSTSGEYPEMRALLQFIRILLTTVHQVCKKNVVFLSVIKQHWGATFQTGRDVQGALTCTINVTAPFFFF